MKLVQNQRFSLSMQYFMTINGVHFHRCLKITLFYDDQKKIRFPNRDIVHSNKSLTRSHVDWMIYELSIFCYVTCYHLIHIFFLCSWFAKYHLGYRLSIVFAKIRVIMVFLLLLWLCGVVSRAINWQTLQYRRFIFGIVRFCVHRLDFTW